MGKINEWQRVDPSFSNGAIAEDEEQLEQLERLAALRANGTLSDDEFETLKARALGHAQVEGKLTPKQYADIDGARWLFWRIFHGYMFGVGSIFGFIFLMIFVAVAITGWNFAWSHNAASEYDFDVARQRVVYCEPEVRTGRQVDGNETAYRECQDGKGSGIGLATVRWLEPATSGIPRKNA